MEDLILAGVAIPLTPWTIIHGDRLVPLLDRIRESLPDEVRRSQQILEHRDQILDDAQRRAREMVEEAQTQADSILSESELMKAVHHEAEKIRHQVVGELDHVRRKAYEEIEAMKAKAAEESRTMREDADRYAETILGTLDKSLVEFHQAVKGGQKQIAMAKADASARRPGVPGSSKAYGSRYGQPQGPQTHPGHPQGKVPPAGYGHPPSNVKVPPQAYYGNQPQQQQRQQGYPSNPLHDSTDTILDALRQTPAEMKR